MSEGHRFALSLYPRGWRERYGEEFQSLLGDRRLGLGDWIDIVSGAIDARLTWRSSHAAARAGAAGGRDMATVIQALKQNACGRPKVSTTEALVGAAFIIVGSFASIGLRYWLEARGYPDAALWARDLGFPITYAIVVNAMFLKGQSWAAHAVLTGTLFAIFGQATWIARMI